jgi:hypothetical protein
VLNLNNHPTTCRIYTRSIVSEVPKLTTTPDLFFLVTNICLHAPWKLLHIHSWCSWTSTALIIELESCTFIHKKSMDYTFSASSRFITDQTSEEAEPFRSKTFSTHSIQKAPICSLTKCNKCNFTDSLPCWSLLCCMLTSLIIFKNL